MLSKQEEIRMGRFLSKVLRHRPDILKLELDTQGWTDIDTLLLRLEKMGKTLSKEGLQQVVDNNNKQRYSISEDGQRIRANQGHSIEIELEYSPLEPPQWLYHGTAERFLDSIMTTGLDKRNRHHVHLSLDLETASRVGKRHGKLIILKVDAEGMHKDGYEFFCTPNQVWLTEHVPVKYLSR